LSIIGVSLNEPHTDEMYMHMLANVYRTGTLNQLETNNMATKLARVLSSVHAICSPMTA